MARLYSNLASTTLAASITSTDLSISVADATNFPVIAAGSGDYFVLTLSDTAGNFEYVKVVATSGTSFTVDTAGRGYEGSTARDWNAGDFVELCATAESFTQKADKPASATAGNIAELDNNGNLVDSGVATTDKMDKVPSATAGNVAVFDSAGQVVDGGDFYLDSTSRFLSPFVGLTIYSSGSLVRVRADKLLVKNASGEAKILTGVDVSIDVTTSGVGGLDTGSLVGFTYYYVWVVYDSSTSTVNAVISLAEHSSSPSVPANWDYFAFCGFVKSVTTSLMYDYRVAGRNLYAPELISYTGLGVTSYTAFGGVPYLIEKIGLSASLRSKSETASSALQRDIQVFSPDGTAYSVRVSLAIYSTGYFAYATSGLPAFCFDYQATTGTITFQHKESATVSADYEFSIRSLEAFFK